MKTILPFFAAGLRGLSLAMLVVFSRSLVQAQAVHTLVAHYTFDNPSLPGQDSSGNANNISHTANLQCGSLSSTNDAKAGTEAELFNNNGGTCPNWFVDSSNQVLSAIAGSFSISLWLKTTDSYGSDTDNGFLGEGIVSAFYGGGETVVPMTLNGDKLGFFTGGIPNDTLHSATSINTGRYVHIVVTRNQSTGVKNIYVNGVMDASDTGSTDALNSSPEMDIGYVNGSGKGIGGEIDDVQVYAGVLSASDVSYLYSHPGSNAPAQDFNGALNTVNLTWVTGGTPNGTNGWFVETTTTHDGVSAAQSAPIINLQTNFLRTTVTGPGTLTFYWQTSNTGNNFDLQFNLDGVDYDDIGSGSSWSQDGPFAISAGVHTLSWVAYANGDNSRTESAWLDQVAYIPTQTTPSPFSLLNPQISGSNFQFSFTSQTGFTNTVLDCTNLAAGIWQTYSNLPGDGTLKIVQVPVAGAQNKYFRVSAH